MKIAGGIKQDGIIVGNAYDKYGSRNPVVRRIMQGFKNSLSELVAEVSPGTIHEVGCGEGYWVLQWLRQGIQARGSDFSSQVVEIARQNAAEQGMPGELFHIRSIYDLEPGRDSADLIVCCEVLEHLEDPERGLAALQRVARRDVILSVPCEPIWRVLNLARGKYIKDFGNTPGHLQHWSRSAFRKMVQRYFDVVKVRAPFPWTMIRCRAKTPVQ